MCESAEQSWQRHQGWLLTSNAGQPLMWRQSSRRERRACRTQMGSSGRWPSARPTPREPTAQVAQSCSSHSWAPESGPLNPKISQLHPRRKAPYLRPVSQGSRGLRHQSDGVRSLPLRWRWRREGHDGIRHDWIRTPQHGLALYLVHVSSLATFKGLKHLRSPASLDATRLTGASRLKPAAAD